MRNKENKSRYNREYYKRNKKRILKNKKEWRKKNRDKELKTSREGRKRSREFVEDYRKGKSCASCGWNKHPEILQFHHRSSEKKERNIATMRGKSYTSNRIKKEIKKCVLLCPNCHFWKHKKKLNMIRESNERRLNE